MIHLVANNFWGKDDAGVGPMLDRMHNAKTTCDELKTFYTRTYIPLVLGELVVEAWFGKEI